MVFHPTRTISEIIWNASIIHEGGGWSHIHATDGGINDPTLDVHLLQLSFLLRMMNRKWRWFLQEIQETILPPALYRVAPSTPNADDGWT